MGIELVCSGRHESGAGELAALSQNESVPMVIQRCALRAWLISVDMRAA
jgi:hypothetical protein